jgi:hypothetical protein
MDYIVVIGLEGIRGRAEGGRVGGWGVGETVGGKKYQR